ncbi:hypothetical protein GQ457_15G019060 [Hibiscus cannabinus]
MFFDVLSPFSKPVLPNSDPKASEYDFKPEPTYSIVRLALPVRSAQFCEPVITDTRRLSLFLALEDRHTHFVIYFEYV